MFYWFTNNRVIATSPKVGSRTLTAMLGGPRTNLDVIETMLDDRPISVFIRDPYERLVSCYRHMVLRDDLLVNWQGLVNAILRGSQNVHWMPQAGLHTTSSGRFLPSEVIPFGSFGDTLKGWGYEPLHENPSAKTFEDEDLSYRRAELNDFYEKDLELCRQM